MIKNLPLAAGHAPPGHLAASLAVIVVALVVAAVIVAVLKVIGRVLSPRSRGGTSGTTTYGLRGRR